MDTGSTNPKPEDQETGAFTPWPEQDENGVDLSLIRQNLKLSPLERVRKMYQVTRSMYRMRQRLGRRLDSAGPADESRAS